MNKDNLDDWFTSTSTTSSTTTPQSLNITTSILRGLLLWMRQTGPSLAFAPTTPVLHSKTKPWPISEHVFWRWYTRWGYLVNLRVSECQQKSWGPPSTPHTWGLCVGRKITLLYIAYDSKFRPCPGHAFARGRNVLQRAHQELKNDFSTPNAACTRPFRRRWPTPRWNSIRRLRHFAFQMIIFHARWIRRLWGA